MLTPSWSLKLSQQPLHCTISKIPSASIIFQGVSNHLIAFTNNESIPLPLRKQIIQIASLPTSQILLLTRYDLTCFSLSNNDQVFVKEFQNANQMYLSKNYIYVISGSDITCFTHEGEQQYVNHLANNVFQVESAYTNYGQELIVALDDMSMKRFKEVNITFDYTKVAGIVNALCWVDNGVMIGTQEGTIAYYQGKKSKWKAKSTHPTFKIINWENNNQPNVIVVRKNGNIEIRDHKKGETIHKLKLNEPPIMITLSDFRTTGVYQLLCICKSAAVKAFNFQQRSQPSALKPQQPQKGMEGIGDEVQNKIKQFDMLLKQKAQMEYEIKQLEDLLSRNQHQEGGEEGENPLNQNFTITATTAYEKGMALKITCKNGFISGLSFQQPILPVRIQRSQTLQYIFQKSSKIVGEIVCEALCHSNFMSKSYEIRSFKINLSKFWHWGYVKDRKKGKQIQGCIKFNLVQRNARYIKWIRECFFFDMDEAAVSKMQMLNVMSLRFYNDYEGEEMEMVFKSKEGKVEIYCDQLQILGEVVQDLMEYVGAKELQSTLTFPTKEISKLKSTLQNIEKLSQTKISINTEMAQAVNNIKFLLVKGESAIAVANLKQLRKSYGEIMNQNQNILLQIEKRNLNTTSLGDSMKVLGKFINQSSNLRFGKPKEDLIKQCRQAIKRKDFHKIISLMEKGVAIST